MAPPPPPSYQGIGLKTGMRPIANTNTNTNTNNEDNNDDDDDNDDSNNNNDDTNTNTNIKIKTKNKTRTIRISEELYKKFFEHSRRYYNTETYETILENLLKCYDEHNQDKYWFNNGNNKNNDNN